MLLAVPGLAQKQRMAVPSYFYPGPIWSKLAAATPTVGLAIINPNSGPGLKPDPVYVAEVRTMQSHGIRVLGYVHTSYAKRDIGVVQAEAADYFRWYKVNGIFFDEVTNDAQGLPYYLHCDALTRAMNPKAIVVLNPGTQTTEGYMRACDVLCNFESDDTAYQTQYSAPAWVKKYPARRFWQIVLDVPSVPEMQKDIREAKARHAGWVFITSFTAANNGNPYDKLPDNPYWSDELAALAAH
jgi:hypothetical protein